MSDAPRNIDIRLTEQELAHVMQAAASTAAIARECIARYAEPHERRDIARRIDPETALVFFIYAQTLDPYGDDPELPEEYHSVGREFFAVDPDEGVAVWYYDLPAETQEALTAKRETANRQGWERLLRTER